MRVLHLGRFYNDQFGGLERHVDQLLRGLSPYCQIDNLVAHDRWAYERVDLEGYVVHKVPSLGTFAGTAICPTMPFKARALHRTYGYDIVHLHFPDPTGHLVSYWLPREVRLVITWHSDIVRQKRLLTMYRPFLNQIIQRADAIIAATPRHFSSSVQLSVSRHPERFHVVPFGLDYGALDMAARREDETRALRGGASRIVFAVGRHVYYKGYDYLIRAMAAVPDAVLWMGGAGPLTSELKTLTSDLGLTNRIRFLGRIPDGDLPLYYHACDVFCLPSIEVAEAFGLVQLEAMACAKPVVCCELNNGVSYVNQNGKTGLVVRPRDPDALAAALNTLLGNTALRQEMGQYGFERAHNDFGVKAMVDGTLGVYESLMQTSKRTLRPEKNVSPYSGKGSPGRTV